MSDVRAGLLSGRVAIVTGGARGIGLAVTKRFVAEGAKVLVGDISEPAADAFEGIGDSVAYQSLDVRSQDEWHAAVAACVDAFGPPSILMSNAGVMVANSIAETDGSEYLHAFQVNVIGSVLGLQAVVPSMRENGGGSVIVVASSAAMMGVPGFSAYAASKAAAVSFARSAALEFGHDGIRVNSLVPGGVDTAMSSGPEFADFDQAAWFARKPIPRIGRPEEIAAAATFLASDESSYATGAPFIIDGGELAGPPLS